MRRKEDIKTVRIDSGYYPERLKAIYDPPDVLYYRGELLEEDSKAIAIVGSRKCSAYGVKMAESLARGLAERGITVVSGMARGIDTASHKGALEAGGRTIAVMGSGFGRIYPPEAGSLLEEIASSGCVITEYPIETPPLRWNFPKRNRIISGLSLGVVVVEAARKSGALITANFALDEGREVFAVPGRADLNTSSGTNALIQAGAKLVTTASDILDELCIETETLKRSISHAR